MINKTKKIREKIPQKVEALVVGGGIVGAGLFRDLSLHGVHTLLIDKKDFASQTSSKSSKMLHGGIRYLENADFELVWEALHEKNLWQKIAPHLCREKSFFLPIFKDSLRPLWMLRAGLYLYDFLSSFENKPHQVLNAQETIAHLPHIRQEGLKGAGVYHDVYMDDIKLCLENIYDGLHVSDNSAHNYVSLEKIEKLRGRGLGYRCYLLDQLTGKEYVTECRHLAFCTGPFTDQIMKQFLPKDWTDHLLPSKGSHLWLKRDSLKIDSPVVITPKDGRVIFVMPWEYSILVGTTEVPIQSSKDQSYFDLTISSEEQHYLIQALNEFFPSAKVSNSDILSTFAGVRPLAKEGNFSLGKTAREHKYLRPQRNMHVLLGGKYTTFRKMVQETAQNITQEVKKEYCSKRSMDALHRPSIVPAFSDVLAITAEQIERVMAQEMPRTFDDLIIRRLGIPDPQHFNFLAKRNSFEEVFGIYRQRFTKV